MFSKACEYGIKAVSYIATKTEQGERVKVQDIIKNCESPVAFTGKILSTLTKNKIITSTKGPYGGFSMDLTLQKKTMLSDVVKVIDGDEIYKGCALGLKQCNSKKPCPLHHQFVQIRSDLKNMLVNTSIYDLTKGLKNSSTILKR